MDDRTLMQMDLPVVDDELEAPVERFDATANVVRVVLRIVAGLIPGGLGERGARRSNGYRKCYGPEGCAEFHVCMSSCSK